LKRRILLATTIALGAVVAAVGVCVPNIHRKSAETPAVTDNIGHLAGRTLEDLREEYRHWLFDDFLPFMDKYVIDYQYGGFICEVDRDGTMSCHR